MIARFVAIAMLGLCAGCTTPPNPAPILPDATYDGGCGLDQAITQARLIRVDGGASLVIPCPDGSP